jgi:hypothetical protein
MECDEQVADVFGTDHCLAIGTPLKKLDTFELDAPGCDLLRFE